MTSSTQGAATLLAFLVALGAIGPADAQPRSVVVVDASGQQQAGSEAVQALRRALAANPRLQATAATDITRALVGPLPAGHTSATPSASTERLEAADDAIAKFDYDRALIQLFRAERPLIDHRPTNKSRERLADINFRLGLIYLAQGDRARARSSFGAVHFLVPARELDPARYPPDVVGAFERARPGPKDSTLSVSASVEGAAIFVDGRPTAQAPGEIAVTAGVHYVLVSKPGYRSSGRRVETQPGGVEPVRIPLGPRPATTLVRQLRRRLIARKLQVKTDVVRAGREAAALTGVDVAIVVTAHAEGLRARAVGKTDLHPSFPMPADALALADELAPAPIYIPGPVTTKRVWYRRPWALAAMGGAALAVISVTTVVILSSGDEMRQTGGLCFPPDC